MQWTNTLSGTQWALLALVPPAIVALYFLKLKRQPVQVPSTYLWRKTIEDLQVNSLWQRLRQNLLLLLQLILMALLILALLRPAYWSSALSGERVIFLIDNSASMNATDVAPTRLDEAKRRATEMIESMASNQKGMVISFSDVARVEQGLTADRDDLLAAVADIQPSNRTTSLDEALRVAVGMANPGGGRDDAVAESSDATLYIYSDGRFADVHDFSLGTLAPVFVPIGEAKVDNLGIVAFGAQPDEKDPNKLQVFGRIENHGPEAVTTSVELHLPDRLLDASEITVEPGASAGVAFEMTRVDSGSLRMELPREDRLAADNTAWAALNPPRRAKVLLVANGTSELQPALSTAKAAALADVTIATPALLETAEHRRQAAAGDFDLIIYDGSAPAEMPAANTLFIGSLPPAGWTADEAEIGAAVIDVSRTHPLMQDVDMADVEIYEARPLIPPAGGMSLLDSSAGSFIAIGPREGFEDAVLGFGFTSESDEGVTPNTTWPIRRSFPVFTLNVLSYLGGQSEVGGQVAAARPGQPVALQSILSADDLAVLTPSGQELPVDRGRRNVFPFHRTEELGVYGLLSAESL